MPFNSSALVLTGAIFRINRDSSLMMSFCGAQRELSILLIYHQILNTGRLPPLPPPHTHKILSYFHGARVFLSLKNAY